MHSPLNRDFEQPVVVAICILIGFKKKTKKVEQQSSRNSIKCNCQWLIKFNFLNRRKKDSVKISHVKKISHHTKTCTPAK